MKNFNIASEEYIRNGKTADIYFHRALDVIEKDGKSDIQVVAEVTTNSLPESWNWGILAGIPYIMELFKGRDINIYSYEEGTFFGVNEPVIVIEGNYSEFAVLETALLGIISQISGICTKAARFKKIAIDKPVYSFGIRRLHPAISAIVDEAAYKGGLDGVSGVFGSEILKTSPVGTMPHALILLYPSPEEAWKAYDKYIDKKIPRILLADTVYDEKTEVLKAIEVFGRELYGIRLDTPSSRRGNMRKIVEEVRWELDIRGYTDTKILVSGGLKEGDLPELIEAGADAFGVGTAVSTAPSINFSLDIVEVAGVPKAKRDRKSGRKVVYRCEKCLETRVVAAHEKISECECGGNMEMLLKPLIKSGKPVREIPDAHAVREYVLEQLGRLSL